MAEEVNKSTNDFKAISCGEELSFKKAQKLFGAVRSLTWLTLCTGTSFCFKHDFIQKRDIHDRK